MKRQFLAVVTAVGALTCLMAWPAVAQSVKATPVGMHNDNSFARIAPKVHTTAFDLEREFGPQLSSFPRGTRADGFRGGERRPRGGS